MYTIYLMGVCFLWGGLVTDSWKYWDRWSFWTKVGEIVSCLIVALLWPIMLGAYIFESVFYRRDNWL